MKTRITQLILRFISYALTGTATWVASSDTETAQAFTETFTGEGSLGVLAAMAAAADLYMHRQATGGVFTLPVKPDGETP